MINENRKQCVIILPTHSNYIDICENFLYLFYKNWSNCPFKVVVSITGKDVKLKNTNCFSIYNGKDSTLTECIVKATKEFNADYYMCFLGDAFINRPVDNKWISRLLVLMKSEKIEYCSLMYVKNYARKKSLTEDFRFISSIDRYSHTFVAFVASNNFVQEIIAKCKNDFEFECKYLKNQTGQDAYYYSNHIIVTHNILNIVPAITKGKWDRIAYNKLRKSNPEMKIAKRPIENWGETFYQHAHDKFISFLPYSIRISIKRILSNKTKKIVTKE